LRSAAICAGEGPAGAFFAGAGAGAAAFFGAALPNKENVADFWDTGLGVGTGAGGGVAFLAAGLALEPKKAEKASVTGSSEVTLGAALTGAAILKELLEDIEISKMQW
jgi:hypothetical protein